MNLSNKSSPYQLYTHQIFWDKKSQFCACLFLLASVFFVSASGRWFSARAAVGGGAHLGDGSFHLLGGGEDGRRRCRAKWLTLLCAYGLCCLSSRSQRSRVPVSVRCRCGVDGLIDLCFCDWRSAFLCVVQSEMRNTPVLGQGGHSSEAPSTSSPAAASELSSPLAAADQTPPLRTVRRTRLSDKALGQYKIFDFSKGTIFHYFSY